jgi:hypothetical protein
MADASCPVLLISGRCLPCWTAAGGAVAAVEDLELFTGTRPSLPVSLDRHRDVVLWNSTASTTNSCGDRWCRRGPTCWAWSSTWPASSTAGSARPSGARPSRCRSTTTRNQTCASRPTDDILAFYRRARAAADQVINELAVDDLGTAWFGEAVTVRWVLIHMIEETARHAGHMDIVRESHRRSHRRLPDD